jgi:hypothetical protein
MRAEARQVGAQRPKLAIPRPVFHRISIIAHSPAPIQSNGLAHL